MVAGGNAAWAKVFAALIIVVMTAVNIVGVRSGGQGADRHRLYRRTTDLPVSNLVTFDPNSPDFSLALSDSAEVI
jgi:hypothetical protein